VRHYQSEGLLPRPIRRGRVGLYDDAHLERLRVIAQLQDRGLNLRTIRDALRHVDRGGFSLQEWLGVEADLSAPWLEEQPILLDEAALKARLGDAPRGLRTTLERNGLLDPQGSGQARSYLVRSPGLLDITLRLHAAGIEVDTASAAAEILRRRLGRACSEVITLMSERTGKGFTSTADPAEVSDAMKALRGVGGEAVRIIFAQEMEAALQKGIERGLIKPRTEQRKRRPGRKRPHADQPKPRARKRR
jgi:DNA-binding transcriptional MerR regulator